MRGAACAEQHAWSSMRGAGEGREVSLSVLMNFWEGLLSIGFQGMLLPLFLRVAL
jgi:hypothetical protein